MEPSSLWQGILPSPASSESTPEIEPMTDSARMILHNLLARAAETQNRQRVDARRELAQEIAVEVLALG